MEKVYIAIECMVEHKASIYALITSIIMNKNLSSKYCIYILTNKTKIEEWTSLLELESNTTEILLYQGSVKDLSDVDKIIYLQWNTLVMGDLSELYRIDLEGKAFAAAVNFPENTYLIPNENTKYNPSVLLLDINKWKSNFEYKEISVFYNYGYEEVVKNKETIYETKLDLNIKKEIYTDLKEWALILRMDKENPPEKYFDSPLSEIWMNYYKLSALKDIDLVRNSSIESSGIVEVDKEKAIPILIKIEDADVPYVMALILSLKENLNKFRMLDIRLVYTQLSQTHKEMLLSLIDKNTSIILYNIEQYYINYPKGTVAQLMSLIFIEYKKALCIFPKCICVQDISKLYDLDMEDYCVRAVQELKEDLECIWEDIYFKNYGHYNSKLILINIEQWNKDNLNKKIQELLLNKHYKKYSFIDIMSIVCRKKIAGIPKVWNEYLITSIDEKYQKFMNTYIGNTFWLERIKEEIIFYEKVKDINMEELLKKIQKIETDNQNLKKQNKKLETQNKNLKKEKNKLLKERDRFLYEILEIRKSITYKIGRLITFIPRKLRGSK